MHQKVLLRKIVVLMFMIISITLVNAQDTADSSSNQVTLCEGDTCSPTTPDQTEIAYRTTVVPSTVFASTAGPTKAPETTVIPTTVPAKQTTLSKRRPTRRPAKDYYDDSDEDSDENDESDESNLEVLNIWITYVDPWEYHNRANNKRKGHGSSRKPQTTKKPAATKVRFPVRHYPNYRQFPTQRFSPLVSIVPWLPIFYDKSTYQTVIFSPSGGIYVMPPLINFYGQRFSVAQLIQWGYASLVSTGAPPPANVDVASFVQPSQAVSNAGTQAPGSGLLFDEKKVQFKDGVKTQFRKFKPQYSSTLYEAADNSGESRYTYRNP